MLSFLVYGTVKKTNKAMCVHMASQLYNCRILIPFSMHGAVAGHAYLSD